MTPRWRPPAGSLFWRLLLAIGSMVVVVVLVSTMVLSDFMRSALKRQMSEMMLQDARGVALWAAPYMANATVQEDVLHHMPWLNAVTEGRLWLVTADAVVVGDSASHQYEGRQVDHPWVRRVLAGEALEQHDPDPWLRAAITVGHPITDQGKVVGAVFLFNAPSRIREISLEFSWLIVVTGGLTLVTGLLAAYTLARSFSRPIEQMARFAEGLGQQRFGGPLPDTRITELERLASSLGSAGAQLQAAFDELSEEKQRIQSLIRDMAEGVVAVDEDRKILLVNPAAAQLLGLPGPFDGLDLDEAGLPPSLAATLRTVFAHPQAEVVTFRCGPAEISTRVSPVGEGPGRMFGAVALLRDVSGEGQLRRMRENFVANVSHELRGPLAALSAGVEAMHDGVIPADARPRYLSAMLSEIGRLRRLVDNLMELSRLDAGMLDIAQEEFDLKPLCEELLEKWEPRAAVARITLVAECPHLRVVANYDRVEEILINFLDNALRFTPEGGTIRLFARREGDMIRIGVADTGAGIAREHLPHLWERFYKVDPARTRARGAGTGLGLSICRQLVEHMGGEVAVESEPGSGSTFSFTLVAARTRNGSNWSP